VNVSQTTDREPDAGRRPAVPSNQAIEESYVSNPTHVFNHTGWHLDGDQAVYLHAGGALGPSGPVANIRTRLGSGLDRFTLPDPPDGDERDRSGRFAGGPAT
jgi:hypothetical protein